MGCIFSRGPIVSEGKKMRTHYRTCGFSTRSQRSLRSHRVPRPVAGQCFEIDIRLENNRWVIGIPEINEVTEAGSRAAVELAARECIAAKTGIPIGYISVWVRD
jgi:hypothetical protein